MIAALRLPRTPPLPSPAAWFPTRLGAMAGWTAITVTSSYYNGKTYVGFVSAEGSAYVASYNHTTKAWTLSPAIATGLTGDLHNAPTVLVRSSDHKIVIVVESGVGAGPFDTYIATSTNAEDVSAWGAATSIKAALGATSTDYPNLFQLSGESGKLYLLWRDGSNDGFYFSTSTDDGATWAARTELVQPAGTLPFWAAGSDDSARIDYLVTDGNSLSGDLTSLYHFYYSGGSYHKSDGTVITGLPFAVSSLTKMFDGSVNGHPRVPYTIINSSGTIYAVWAALNTAGTGSNMNYWYGILSGGAWTIHQITDTGSVPDPAEGGISLDPTDPSRVFLSKKTSGVWQVFKYETTDGGSTWAGTQLTFDAPPNENDGRNNLPLAPRDASAALTCVWLFGPSVQNLTSQVFTPTQQIRGYLNPIQPF